jgi:hypothetical protein
MEAMAEAQQAPHHEIIEDRGDDATMNDRLGTYVLIADGQLTTQPI